MRSSWIPKDDDRLRIQAVWSLFSVDSLKQEISRLASVIAAHSKAEKVRAALVRETANKIMLARAMTTREVRHGEFGFSRDLALAASAMADLGLSVPVYTVVREMMLMELYRVSPPRRSRRARSR